MSIQSILQATKVNGNLYLDDDAISGPEKIAGLTDQFSTINTNVSTLSSNVDTLSSNVGTISSDIVTLSSDVATLSSDVATLQSQSGSSSSSSLSLTATRSIVDHTSVTEGTVIYEQNLKSLRQFDGKKWENMKSVNHKLLPNLNWGKLGGNITGESNGDSFGRSVDINADGTVIAVGASFNDGRDSNTGHVRVLKWNGTSWVQRGNDIDGELSGNQSGHSVSLSDDGSIVAIGSPEANTQTGHVRVYQWNGTSWSKLGNNIVGSSTADRFGYSISLNSDGTIIAISAYSANSNTGLVRIHQWNGGSTWTQIGSTLDGEANSDWFGYSVSLNYDGTVVVVGAMLNDGNGSNSGHARVFQYDGSIWSQLGSDLDGENINDQSGSSVSINGDGTRIAIGAEYNVESGGNSKGHARVYDWNGTTWSQLGSDIDGEDSYTRLGGSVSLSQNGNILAVGAPGVDRGLSVGEIRVFEWTGLIWRQLASTIENDTNEEYSELGAVMAISADGMTIVGGMGYNDMVQVFSLL